GRLVPKKNHEFLIDVVHHLSQKYPKRFVLKIFGEGEMHESLQAKITDYGLQNSVFLMGVSDSIEEHYRNSDLYLHSAIDEPFGLTILEAMASGLPVVTLDGGGNRDFIVHEENGFILPVSDVEAFSDVIMKIVNNSHVYDALSKKSVETSRNYDIANYINKLLEVYETY
ncbi:MAG: glycosyltransferase, partial [Bacteroidota bacterium]